jgi:hypothetical protein
MAPSLPLFILHFRCQDPGFGDIPRLRPFVPAAEQNDQRPGALHEIDSVSRPIIDSELGDAFPDGLRVADETRLQTHDPLRNSLCCSPVREAVEPFAENWRLPDFDHV